MLRRLKRLLAGASYRMCLWALWPVNRLLARRLKDRVEPGSVLHVSHMVHVAHETVRLLRRSGLKADYLAVGTSSVWDRCDYRAPSGGWPFVRPLREAWLVWRVVSRYECVHLHFGLPATQCGWELPLLKRMGRKIVVHWRGCEIRDRARNMKLHARLNICEDCDYAGAACSAPAVVRNRRNALRYGDRFLATTPDLLDFAPQAEHVPFYAPEVESGGFPAAEPKPADANGRAAERKLRIVHATNHPGIEGTERIAAAIESLQRRGFPVEFVILSGVPHDRVLEAYRTADLAIGKMKMGYYANAQIESMALGVPTITWVRPDLVTERLARSGLILCHLDDLEATLEFCLTHPEFLEQKRRVARQTILELHDNGEFIERHVRIYRQLTERPAA